MKNTKNQYMSTYFKTTKKYIEDKQLLPSDFQITEEINYLFTKILGDRLISINNNELRKNDYGLTTNDDGSIGFLYTTIEEEFVRRILLYEDFNNV